MFAIHAAFCVYIFYVCISCFLNKVDPLSYKVSVWNQFAVCDWVGVDLKTSTNTCSFCFLEMFCHNLSNNSVFFSLPSFLFLLSGHNNMDVARAGSVSTTPLFQKCSTVTRNFRLFAWHFSYKKQPKVSHNKEKKTWTNWNKKPTLPHPQIRDTHKQIHARTYCRWGDVARDWALVFSSC